MSKHAIDVVTGIGAAACCVGLATVGLVFGNALAKGTPQGEHAWFPVARCCIAAGMVAVIATFGARAKKPSE